MVRRVNEDLSNPERPAKPVPSKSRPGRVSNTAYVMKRYSHWQETVATLGQIALDSNDLQQLMTETVRRVADALQIDFVAILELDPGNQSLLLRAGHGWPSELIGTARIEANQNTQAGMTLLAKEPVVVTDVMSDTRFNHPPKFLTDQGIRCGITVAIEGYSKPFGVLGAHSRSQRAFDSDDVHFLRSVASILATAIRGQESDQALRDSHARVQAVVNTLIDGIITIDAHGLIESLNPAAEKIFGYSSAELIGKNVSILMPNPYQREHDGYIANYLQTGIKRIIGIGREVSGLRKDGTTFPMDLAVSELRVRGKRMFTGVVRDITDRRRMEREILESAAEEQRRIGQDLHDGLCQHLAGIAFAVEVLSQKLAARAAPEAGNLNKVGEMIDQAITQARDLARGLQPVTLDASGFIDALKSLVDKIEETFHLSCMLVCDGPCLVHDNSIATHLFRISQEAITNAIKHGKAHTIIVDVNEAGEQLTLSIKDDGIGFQAAGRDSVGMGLRSMEYRARVIGGTLTVRPGEKGGTTITCTVRNSPLPVGVIERAQHGNPKARKTISKEKDPSGGRSPNRPRTPR